MQPAAPDSRKSRSLLGCAITVVPRSNDGMTKTGIAVWLAVNDAAAAVEFYHRAFDAVEEYRLGEGDAVEVARLEVYGAPFGVQHDPGRAPATVADSAARMIVTVEDPDAWFDRAVSAGAETVSPVHEEYGWRTGRVRDPFG